jgi:tetratricopeptide (TPR) repeat protein
VSSVLLHTLVASLLGVLIFAIYAQVRDHEFVNLDDPIYVVDNPNLQSGLGLETLGRAFSEPYETNWIPLTWVSLLIDHALFGFDPAGYHIVNVILHTLSAVLLYFVLIGMTGAPAPSAMVAVIFAVHPIHVESVAWVSERKDALSGVFWMLTLGAYWFYTAKTRSIGRYLLLAMCFALGLLAKPMLVSLPLVLLLLDFWPLGRLRKKNANALLDLGLVKRALLEKLPLFALCAMDAAVTLVVQRDAGAMSRGELLSFSARSVNALNSYVVYLIDSFWPSRLSILYPHPMGEYSAWLAAAQAAGLVVLTIFCARLVRSRPYLIVGWLWYLITLVPVIGLIQVGLQARADRYMYLPQIGVTIALVWGVRDLFAERKSGRAVLSAVAIASVAALTVIAWQQAAHWRNTMALYSHAVAVNDENPMAHHGLAGQLGKNERWLEAEVHFARSVELSPHWAGAHIGLADSRAAQGRLDAAIEGYRQALKIAPRHARAHAHLGKALAESGKLGAAIRQHRRALELYGDRPTAEAYAYLASALAEQGDLADSERFYRKALVLRPTYAAAHENLGFVLARADRHREAYEQLERALELGEESPELCESLASTAAQLGDPHGAALYYRQALQLRPGWIGPANNLAWLLATHPDPQLRDGAEAVAVVESLVRDQEARNPALLDTLAAAYAAAGRFEQARATAARAVELARSQGAESLADEIGVRLSLYRDDTAFIDELASTGP